jgi:hypothetical protein
MLTKLSNFCGADQYGNKSYIFALQQNELKKTKY